MSLKHFIKTCLVFLVFLAISLLWFWKGAFSNYLFCYRDLTYLYYPVRHFMAQLVQTGAIPLWNQYLSLGFPLLATHLSGVFYPLSLLYYILPFDLAFNWFIILHFSLGAFFIYLLCRDLEFSAPASFASGLVFVFSGYTLSLLDMLNFLAAVVWLPLVVLFFRRSLRAAARPAMISNAVWAAFFLTIMFLGGAPAVLYGTLWLLLGYLLFVTYGKWKELGRGAIVLAFIGSLTAALSAFQLFPFLELLMHTTRAQGSSFAEAARYSLDPGRLITFVMPAIGSGLIRFLYLGLVPVLLALLAFVLNKDKRIWWLGLLIFLVILVILGPHSPVPLYYLLYKFMPGFSFFRYPIKFMFILIFSFSLLAGRGIDLLWLRFGASRRVSRGLFCGGLALLVFLDLYLVNTGLNLSIPTDDYKEKPRNIKILEQDRSLFRYFSLAEMHFRSYGEGDRDLKDYKQTLLSFRNRLAPNQNMLYHLSAVDGYGPFVGREQQRIYRYIFAINMDLDHRLLDMLNIKYIISPRRIKSRNFKLLNREPERSGKGEILLYENLNVLPRAFLVPKTKVFNDREKMLNYMFSQRFNPIKEILLESNDHKQVAVKYPFFRQVVPLLSG